MPITKSAEKALRSSARKRVYNDRRRRALKRSVKTVSDLATEGKNAEARAGLPAAYAAIDKAAKSGVIKKNTAARKKSRLSNLIAKKAEK